MSFFYLLSWALIYFKTTDWKLAVLRGSAAVVLGLAYFFVINGATLNSLIETVRLGREFSAGPFGTFSQYFIFRAYYRHLPELVLLLIAGFFFVRRKLYLQHRFLSIALILTLIGSLIIRRGLYIYVIYYFPLFIMLLVITAAHFRRQALLAIMFVALLLPQYSFLWWTQGRFDFDRYVTAVREAVPDDGTPIVGSSNNWFAFMETNRFHDFYVADKVAEEFPSLYVIEGYFPPYNSGRSVERGLAAIREAYDSQTEIASFDHFGKTFTVNLWERDS
jgi:hypothetical protein